MDFRDRTWKAETCLIESTTPFACTLPKVFCPVLHVLFFVDFRGFTFFIIFFQWFPFFAKEFEGSAGWFSLSFFSFEKKKRQPDKKDRVADLGE